MLSRLSAPQIARINRSVVLASRLGRACWVNGYSLDEMISEMARLGFSRKAVKVAGIAWDYTDINNISHS